MIVNHYAGVFLARQGPWGSRARSLMSHDFVLRGVRFFPRDAGFREESAIHPYSKTILISGEIHMNRSLVHIFSCGNSYGPMVPESSLKFPPTLVTLVHGWLFPGLTLLPSDTKLGNASLFTKSLFTIFGNKPPPLPTRKMRDFLLNSIRRTSNRIANTQPKLRTNPPKIVNKQNYEQMGVSEKLLRK